MPATKRDPRVLLGYVTAVTYAGVMSIKLYWWGLEDKTHIPLILAPLLLMICGLIGYRWWVKHREREEAERRTKALDLGKTLKRCKKCRAVLDGVEPGPVSIGGLNVVRVVCPKCGRIET